MWKTLCISFAIVLALLVSFALARTFDGVFTEKAVASEDKKMEELGIPGEALLECLVSLEKAKKGVSIIFNGIGEHDHYSVARCLIVRVERRKEEATKIAQLKSTYGSNVRYILFLCGYFDSGYLGYEAAEGIDWVWEHRIDDLAEFGV